VGIASGYKLALQKDDLKPDIPVVANWIPRGLNPILPDLVPWPTVETLLGKTDAYIATNYHMIPARHATTAAYIHDVGRLTHAHLYRERQVVRFRRVIRRCARFADLLVAPTESVRDEILRLEIAPADRVRVVPLGVRALPEPTTDVAVAENAPFLLCVGSLDKHKNVPFLLRAFARASHRMPHHLVVAGGMGSDVEEVLAAARTDGASSRIHFLGHTDEANLASLYRRADFTVCPSLYEGFGLPLLEAMASGCPVLATDIAAHREVSGGAARLISPDSEDAFAEGLVELARDEATRADLSARGLKRSREFSWDRTSKALKEVLTQLPAR
jgi:alpha-1,3-rhamnosyl/mannosyltransferase